MITLTISSSCSSQEHIARLVLYPGPPATERLPGFLCATIERLMPNAHKTTLFMLLPSGSCPHICSLSSHTSCNNSTNKARAAPRRAWSSDRRVCPTTSSASHMSLRLWQARPLLDLSSLLLGLLLCLNLGFELLRLRHLSFSRRLFITLFATFQLLIK